jgi:Spy/CpxP family protein refolding chaperone
MKKIATTFLLLCVFSVPAVFAQDASAQSGPDQANRGARMIQHRVSYLTSALSLNPAQQTQVTTILTNAETSESAVQNNMRAAHATLKTAVQSNDAAAMEQASNSIGTLTAQSTLAHAKADAAIFLLLTPDQQSKMSQLEPEGRRGGPGGPGGPGGGPIR